MHVEFFQLRILAPVGRHAQRVEDEVGPVHVAEETNQRPTHADRGHIFIAGEKRVSRGYSVNHLTAHNFQIHPEFVEIPLKQSMITKLGFEVNC